MEAAFFILFLLRTKEKHIKKTADYFLKRKSLPFLLYKIAYFNLANASFDSANSFCNIFIACSIAHTNAFGSTKRSAAYTSYMSFFEQIHRQVIRIFNLTFTITLSEEVATFREQIESTLRYVHSNPGTSFANFTIRSRRRSNAFCILSPVPVYLYMQLQQPSEIQNKDPKCTDPATYCKFSQSIPDRR